MSRIKKHSILSKLSLLVLVVLLFFNQSNAQSNKLDSLQKELKFAKDDTTKINILFSISDLYSYENPDTAIAYCLKAKSIAEKINDKKRMIKILIEIGWNQSTLSNFDKALLHYMEALEISKELNDSKYIATSMSGIGTVYWNQSNYEKALEYFYKSLEIATSVNDKNGIIRNYTSIGIVYMDQGDYPKSLDFLLKALKIAEELKDETKIFAITTNIGIVYKEQNNYQKALDYYFKALKISEKADDKNSIASQLGNIGVVYMDQKEYSKALDYFFKALKIFENLGDKNGVGINFGNIGLAYQHLKDYSKALDYYNKALEINKELGRKYGISRHLGNIGVLYTLTKNYKDSETYLLKALAIADTIGALELTRKFEEPLSNLYTITNRPLQAFEHYKKFIAARDTIFSEDNKNKIIRSEMKFEFEQKEIKSKAEQDKKEALYQGEIKQQRIIGWGIATSLIFLLLFSILLFNRYRLKQKQVFQEKLMQQQKEQTIAIMETQEQERKRIAEDLHDSLGHLLSTVKINLQTLPDNQRHHYINSLQLLNQASKEIHNISFNLMPQTLEEEGLIPALNELAEKIRKSSLYDIILQVHDMENFVIDKQTKFNIYRIVQEAVSNILKHADAKEINIQLVKQEKQLTIMIEDDGKGFDANKVKKNGRGLRNITARAEWLLGTIQIDSTPGKGTTISIEIPI